VPATSAAPAQRLLVPAHDTSLPRRVICRISISHELLRRAVRCQQPRGAVRSGSLVRQAPADKSAPTHGRDHSVNRVDKSRQRTDESAAGYQPPCEHAARWRPGLLPFHAQPMLLPYSRCLHNNKSTSPLPTIECIPGQLPRRAAAACSATPAATSLAPPIPLLQVGRMRMQRRAFSSAACSGRILVAAAAVLACLAGSSEAAVSAADFGESGWCGREGGRGWKLRLWRPELGRCVVGTQLLCALRLFLCLVWIAQGIMP